MSPLPHGIKNATPIHAKRYQLCLGRQHEGQNGRRTPKGFAFSTESGPALSACKACATPLSTTE